MKQTCYLLVFCIATIGASPPSATGLPRDFVYLRDVAPSIAQDIRYAGYHNFVGRPIRGYDAAECIVTKEAAAALLAAQLELEEAGLSLRVYDCYRPTRAVADFWTWSKNAADQKMKDEFYPRVDKAQLFKLGYLAQRSPHSRGSTIDVTLDRLPLLPVPVYDPSAPLTSCIAPFHDRYHDGSMDMGTTYDCMDELSGTREFAGIAGGSHRHILRGVMERHGFQPNDREWWHYVLKSEPFPKTYFDFPIQAQSR